MTDKSSEQERKTGIGLALVIIGISLATGIGIALSPRSVQMWILTVGAVPVTLAAAVKFTAAAVLAWRRNTFILAVLWAVLSLLFLLMLLADGQYLLELILAAKVNKNG